MRIRTVQKPHPPLWYGTASSHRNEWAAEHDVNLLCLVPNARSREVFDDYREKLARLGKNEPCIGLARQLIVAETDAEAGGFRLEDCRNVRAWIGRIAALPGYVPMD